MKVILRLQNSTIVNEVPIEANTGLTIGRSSNSDFKVSDALMSATHCRITLVPPKLEIIDLDSKNGTYINGIRIEQADIFLGDEIKIGSTKISILQDKMDENSINALTFPGKPIDRGIQNLQLDFTGARTINQNNYKTENRNDKRPTDGSIDKEVETRIKANSKIKLSKQEIKLKYKKNSSLAATLDGVLMIFALALPLIIVNFLFLMKLSFLQDRRLETILFAEILSVSLIYLINFKLLKFSLGEKLTGIQSKYLNQ